MDMPVNIPLRICFAIAFPDAAERERYFPPSDGINETSKKELPNAATVNGTKQRPIP